MTSHTSTLIAGTGSRLDSKGRIQPEYYPDGRVKTGRVIAVVEFGAWPAEARVQTVDPSDLVRALLKAAADIAESTSCSSRDVEAEMVRLGRCLLAEAAA